MASRWPANSLELRRDVRAGDVDVRTHGISMVFKAVKGKMVKGVVKTWEKEGPRSSGLQHQEFQETGNPAGRLQGSGCEGGDGSQGRG